MKHLKEILEEIMATPGNTMGAGNPTLPAEADGQSTGSGDTCVCKKTVPIKKIKQKKRKGSKYPKSEEE